MSYSVIDNNDDVLETVDLSWAAQQSARFHGFRVRDDETLEVEWDYRRKEGES